MPLNWDYSAVAQDYSQRPPYAPKAINIIIEHANLGQRSAICDVGAGTGRLTRVLAGQGVPVTAIEPSAEMRAVGEAATSGFPNVSWVEATGEQTGCEDKEFDLVVYGSSFHTVDRKKALIEAARILKSTAWFACLWNHRDLNDPLQSRIDEFIANQIPGYAYGIRREDQTQILQDNGSFSKVQRLNFPFVDKQTVDSAMAHWRSHMTLIRQAKDKMPQILTAIERMLRAGKKDVIEVPYNTRVWLARKGM